MKLSVIIPAYNEDENIRVIISDFLTAIKTTSEIDDYEIIVVDDHSLDNTFTAVSQFNDYRIKCIRLNKRCGSHIAVRAGMKNASGDAVLYISADGQEDPHCLKTMLPKLQEGANVVWALRKDRRDEPWRIKVPACLFYKIQKWFNRDESNVVDSYRADFYLLDRIVTDAVNSCLEKNTSIFGLITWLGFNQDFVEYERRKRKYGKSKWTFTRRVKLALDWIIAFSGLPLRIISVIGIVVASLGFIYAIFIIITAIKGVSIQGWTSAMAAILILGGIQMIMLGVIGEYLWRNIEESRDRPLYFIEKTNFKLKREKAANG